MHASLSRAIPGAHTISDNLRSGSRSTVPFSKQECEDLLRAISRINCEPHNLICPTIYLTRTLSRFWGQLARTNSLPQLDFESDLYVRRLALVLLRTYLNIHHDSSWSFRVTERYGQGTYRQWGEHYAERIPTGPLPRAPFSGYIRIPLNFAISALFFSIPKSYLEHIKAVSQYQGRLSTVQEIWDQYTRRIVKEYQDFLLIVRLMYFLSSS
jgi:hypothetical protein